MSSPAADEPVGGPARGAHPLLWWAAFACLATMTTVWSLSIPLMGAPDEPAQAIKAVAVARGQFTTRVRRRRLRGLLGATVPDTHVSVPRAYARLYGQPACWQQRAGRPVSCAEPLGDDMTTVDAATYVGTYPPLYYLATGWPSRLLAPEEGVYGMRIVSGLLCAALLAEGVVVALRRGPMTIAALAVAITPMTLFMTGSINPNSVEIAAAICLWLALLELVSEPTHRASTIAWATGAAVVLVAARPLSPAFLATIVAVVGLLAGRRETWRRLRDDVRIRAGAVTVGCATALSVVYIVLNHSLSSFLEFDYVNHQSRVEIAQGALRVTGARIEQAVGVLSWVGFGELHLSWGLVDGWIGAVLGLAGLALLLGRWRERLVVLALIAGGIVLPIAALTITRSGAGWQGRYGLPLLVGIPIVAAWTVERSGRLPRTIAAPAGTLLVAAVAVGYVVAHQRLMTRNVLGAGHQLWAGLSDGVWDGPWSPLALFLVLAAASAAFGTVLIWPMWREHGRRDHADVSSASRTA